MAEDLKAKIEALEKQKVALEQTYQRVLGAIEFAESCLKEEEESKPSPKKK